MPHARSCVGAACARFNLDGRDAAVLDRTPDDGLDRLERAAEVARPELADRLACERLGERLRLLAARGRERRVAVPLDAAVAIPVGLPATDEVELRHGSRTLSLDM